MKYISRANQFLKFNLPNNFKGEIHYYYKLLLNYFYTRVNPNTTHYFASSDLMASVIPLCI